VESNALVAAARLVAGQPMTDADRAALLTWFAERAGRKLNGRP